MEKGRLKIFGFLFVMTLAIALFGINHLASVLKRQAEERWLEKADKESQRITNVSLSWLSLFQAQLRGTASLFFGSENVTQVEFLNAIDLIEGSELEAMIPLLSMAFAEQQPVHSSATSGAGAGHRYTVTLSSDNSQPLVVGQDIAAHPQIRAAILTAEDHPEKVIMGPVFKGAGDQLFTCFAILAPNNGKAGVLVSVVNLSDFFADLENLYIPKGMYLRVLESNGISEPKEATVITGHRKPHPDAVATAHIPIQCGLAHWDYYWDVLPNYQDGAAVILSTVVQFGGNALALAVFAVIASLMLQNERVNHQVAKRTEELSLATDAAKAASRTKSEFLANMSHEIRTPMNGVLGMATLLLGTQLNETQRDYARSIAASGESLLNIINDILDFSKIEAGRLEFESVDFDLQIMIEDIADILAVSANEKGLELSCFIDPAVPCFLVGDPGRLRQVLLNLANNAVKFTSQGEVDIRAEMKEETESRVEILFEVKDTGIGIPEDRINRLFKSFSQVDGSSTRKYGGTGLGLAISKKLVELMNGQIGVRSETERGSIFWFSVWFRKQTKPSDSALAAKPVTDLKSKRILTVEDHAANRAIIDAYLRSWGCESVLAQGGREALALLQKAVQDKSPIDLAIIDVMMSEMDGETLGRIIKNNPLLQNTCCVLLTPRVMSGNVARVREKGFDAYLTKPIKRSQLFSVLQAVFARDPAGIPGNLKKNPMTCFALAEHQKQQIHILLAEDNPINQKVALNMLGRFGYHTCAVGNGKQVLESLALRHYDLILMDIQMPEMDGLETTRAIRESQSNYNRIPIIALTANAMKGDDEKCYAAGMDDYIPKPIDATTLVEKIRHWTGMRRLGSVQK